MSIGTVSGETLRSPCRLQQVVLAQQGHPATDTGADRRRASRSGSTAGAPSGSPSPASAHACRAATIATCSQRSSRRASTLRQDLGRFDRELRGDADRQVEPRDPVGLQWADTPLRPASIASQVDMTSPPSGVVAPIPVMTTSVAHYPSGSWRNRLAFLET